MTTKYVACDGMEFEDEKLCREHEKTIMDRLFEAYVEAPVREAAVACYDELVDAEKAFAQDGNTGDLHCSCDTAISNFIRGIGVFGVADKYDELCNDFLYV